MDGQGITTIGLTYESTPVLVTASHTRVVTVTTRAYKPKRRRMDESQRGGNISEVTKLNCGSKNEFAMKQTANQEGMVCGLLGSQNCLSYLIF